MYYTNDKRGVKMGKFHRLEVREGKGTFREVEGAAVVIVQGVETFVMQEKREGHPWRNEWVVRDRDTGMRASDSFLSKDAAIEDALKNFAEVGPIGYESLRDFHIHHYGRSPSAPEPEIRHIQEPQPPGDPETCAAFCRQPCGR